MPIIFSGFSCDLRLAGEITVSKKLSRASAAFLRRTDKRIGLPDSLARWIDAFNV
ncbi:MAG TPA: hypothetical protein VGG97_01715 [Bryobacteraceae bacterium]|jgi:hypothetical protein